MKQDLSHNYVAWKVRGKAIADINPLGLNFVVALL